MLVVGPVVAASTHAAAAGWNRLNIAFRLTPGAYQPAAAKAA
jgi:hypothetical protein